MEPRGILTTATLGEVYIDEDGHVQYVYGRRRPRLGDLPEERQLRRLLNILGQVSSYRSGSRYNPRTVIRAVNAILPLGKKKAISVIEEFLRVTSRWGDNGRDGVFLVLRTLFEVPNDPRYMPPMYVGAPGPEAPDNPKLLPRFPIVIEGDIPFLVVRGYLLAGEAEDPEAHVRFFRECGTLRAKPLVPTAEPLKALDALVKSDHWTFHGTANRSLDDELRGRTCWATNCCASWIPFIARSRISSATRCHSTAMIRTDCGRRLPTCRN